MKVFLTGSRTYGTPRPDSDIDLVIRVDQTTKTLLEELSEKGKWPGIRFGQLNIIAHTTDEEFHCWERATRYMVNKKKEGIPSTREDAIKIIDAELKKAGRELSQGMS